MKNIIGIDQYGEIYFNLGKYPRKALIDRFYNQHIEKMYVDKKNGDTKHIGYIINHHWITLYELKPIEL